MMLKKLIARSDLLAPASFVLCLGVLALDLVAYYLLGRRPLVSYPEAELAVWTLLIACSWVWAVRWLLAGERRARVSLAAAITLMVGMSALHPYAGGELHERMVPNADPVVTAPVREGVVVEFKGAPWSTGDSRPA